MAEISSSHPHDLRSPILSPPFKNKTETEKICIDDMFQKYCGEFGKWQLKHFILTSLAWGLQAFHSMVMIFTDREPDWKCVSGMECSAGGSVCSMSPESWEWTGGKAASTVSEWSLICSDKYKVGLVQAVFFVGCTIGAGVFGHLSDSFLGRKRSLTVVCALSAIFGFLTTLSPNYWTYVLLRLLTGFSTGGVGLCAFVLATEPVGPSKRGTAGLSTFYFFSSSIAILSGIAYIFQTWRTLYMVTSIPSLLYIILVLPFISESPRWYLVRGRIKEATMLMATIASSNGNHLPEGVVLALHEEVSNSKNETNDLDFVDAKAGSIVDVFRHPATRIRLILAVALNFLGSVVWYGLSLNVTNLETNLYMNVLLNAVSELPAFMLTAVLSDRFGRKPLTIGTMWFSGFFCFMGSLMSNIGVWKVIKMVCGVLGIFGIAGTYNLLFIYTTELFPTVVRNTTLGSTAQAVQMGAILVPFVVVLGGWLPFGVFAVCGILGGMIAFYLPETLNKPLYDTFNGLEAGLA
ncbi:organic cation/carnitine transporter 4 [Lathyrus oleraceus]|uniref:Organic cation/carnitine transporter 4 n=1 Tax=Pisum sativum TaxID=3888 RepID=A0A9D4X1Y9_PEA|nr:organic cation/carnitine transporter 4-like [Pisum sativum]KAI5412137.1 Organic cation/carnitine transporter 4 [Pisum sativum]